MLYQSSSHLIVPRWFLGESPSNELSVWLLHMDGKESLKTRLLSLLRLLLGQSRSLPRRPITLSKPRSRLLHLHHVDDLLAEHDGERNPQADPGHGGVHLVCARRLHSTGRERRGEEQAWLGRSGCSRCERGGVCGVGEECRAQIGRGEGEEVERDEEYFVEGAEGEEDPLTYVSERCSA